MLCKISCIVFSCTHPGHVPEAVIGHGVGLALLSAYSGDISLSGHGGQPAGIVGIFQRHRVGDGCALDPAVQASVHVGPGHVFGVRHRGGLACQLAHGRAVPVACGLFPGVRLGGDPVPCAVIARGGCDPQIRSRPRQHGPRGVAPASRKSAVSVWGKLRSFAGPRGGVAWSPLKDSPSVNAAAFDNNTAASNE